MSESLEPQIQAINAIVAALEPLSSEARANVLDFVFRSLSIASLTVARPGAPITDHKQFQAASQEVSVPPFAAQPLVTDIRSFAKEKGPGSANQMLAVLGYYLAHLAPNSERRDYISQDDIKKYFIQADFPLPSAPRMTLTNAKNAGYLDAVGDGTYRLNSVGHNLVAHKMGRLNAENSPTPARRKRPVKRVAKKKKSAR